MRWKDPESAEQIWASDIRGLFGPLTRANLIAIFLFTAGALSFYDAAVFDNLATAMCAAQPTNE